MRAPTDLISRHQYKGSLLRIRCSLGLLVASLIVTVEGLGHIIRMVGLKAAFGALLTL
jgi:hypothetical protein